MAGTCDVAIPATILATLDLRRRLLLVAVALGAAPARQHHLCIRFLRNAGHHAGHILEGKAVAKRNLDGVVDVPADAQHSQPVALEHRAALLGIERKAIEIRRLVLLEALAILRFVERHAEHVQRVADPAAFGVIDIGAGNAVVVAWPGHAGISAPRISWRTISRIRSIALRMRGPMGRCAEVAMESGVLRTGARMGTTRTWSPHCVDFTAFKGRTPNPSPCRTKSMTAGMHSISWATRILRSTPASAFSTDMRMEWGRLGMMSGWSASSASVMDLRVLRACLSGESGAMRNSWSSSSGCRSTVGEAGAL